MAVQLVSRVSEIMPEMLPLYADKLESLALRCCCKGRITDNSKLENVQLVKDFEALSAQLQHYLRWSAAQLINEADAENLSAISIKNGSVHIEALLRDMQDLIALERQDTSGWGHLSEFIDLALDLCNRTQRHFHATQAAWRIKNK